MIKTKNRTVSRSAIGVMVGIAAGLLVGQPAAQACSRILWNDNELAVVVGRTMDWPESTEPVLTVLPARHEARRRPRRGRGGRQGQPGCAGRRKYGSLVTTIYGIGTADGLNERGLGVAHAVPQRDRLRPARPEQARRARRAVGAVPARQRGYRHGGAGAARQRPDGDGRSARHTRPRCTSRSRTRAATPRSSSTSAASRSSITAASTGS